MIDPQSFRYLDTRHLVGCVLDIFYENSAREKAGAPFEARSDLWCINNTLREELFGRARKAWCSRTGCNHTYFPLSVDAVARIYFRIRKRKQSEIDKFNEEFHSGPPHGPNLFGDDSDGQA